MLLQSSSLVPPLLRPWVGCRSSIFISIYFLVSPLVSLLMHLLLRSMLFAFPVCVFSFFLRVVQCRVPGLAPFCRLLPPFLVSQVWWCNPSACACRGKPLFALRSEGSRRWIGGSRQFSSFSIWNLSPHSPACGICAGTPDVSLVGAPL